MITGRINKVAFQHEVTAHLPPQFGVSSSQESVREATIGQHGRKHHSFMLH